MIPGTYNVGAQALGLLPNANLFGAALNDLPTRVRVVSRRQGPPSARQLAVTQARRDRIDAMYGRGLTNYNVRGLNLSGIFNHPNTVFNSDFDVNSSIRFDPVGNVFYWINPDTGRPSRSFTTLRKYLKQNNMIGYFDPILPIIKNYNEMIDALKKSISKRNKGITTADIQKNYAKNHLKRVIKSALNYNGDPDPYRNRAEDRVQRLVQHYQNTFQNYQNIFPLLERVERQRRQRRRRGDDGGNNGGNDGNNPPPDDGNGGGARRRGRRRRNRRRVYGNANDLLDATDILDGSAGGFGSRGSFVSLADGELVRVQGNPFDNPMNQQAALDLSAIAAANDNSNNTVLIPQSINDISLNDVSRELSRRSLPLDDFEVPRGRAARANSNRSRSRSNSGLGNRRNRVRGG